MGDTNGNGDANGGGESKGGSAVLTREFVPQELQDREYLKPWLDKPWSKEQAAEVFKKLDGAESLIGKRPSIPDPKTAKPEDLEKFFEQYAEEKPEGYEIPLEKDSKVSPDFVKAVQMAFKAGKINKVQANGFLKVINDFGVEQKKQQAALQAKKDLEFDTLAKTMLSDENKPIMERTRNLIAEHAPSVAKAAVAKLNDENLLIMAAVIDSIYKKYAPEDELKSRSGSGSSSSGGVQEKRERARALQAELLKMKPMDPNVSKKQEEVNQLYKEIAQAS